MEDSNYEKNTIQPFMDWSRNIPDSSDDYLKKYICNQINFNTISILNFKEEFKSIAHKIADFLISTPVEKILNILKEYNLKVCTPNEIPQFSDFKNGTFKICDILYRSGNMGFTFEEIGEYLTTKGKTKEAYIKYGENHSKLAQFLDFVQITKESSSIVKLTLLGRIFIDLDEREQQQLITKQIFKIPVIQNIVKKALEGKTNISEHLQSLSYKTIVRRRPNVKKLLNIIRSDSNDNIIRVIDNIYMG